VALEHLAVHLDAVEVAGLPHGVDRRAQQGVGALSDN
jgi:hypothetical protein